MIRFCYLLNTILSMFYVEVMKYVYAAGLRWVALIMAILWPVLLWKSSRGLREACCSAGNILDQVWKDSVFIGCLLFVVYICVYFNNTIEANKNVLYYIGTTTVLIWFFGEENNKRTRK